MESRRTLQYFIVHLTVPPRMLWQADMETPGEERHASFPSAIQNESKGTHLHFHHLLLITGLNIGIWKDRCQGQAVLFIDYQKTLVSYSSNHQWAHSFTIILSTFHYKLKSAIHFGQSVHLQASMEMRRKYWSPSNRHQCALSGNAFSISLNPPNSKKEPRTDWLEV